MMMNAKPTSSFAVFSLHVPPHSSEAKRGILGSILLDGENDSRVLDLCTENGIIPESFLQRYDLLICNKTDFDYAT